MDTRRLLTTIIIVGVMMVGYSYISKRWNKPPDPAAATAAAADRLDYDKRTEKPAAEGGAPPTVIRMGDAGEKSKDKLSVTINTQTAGIELAQLNVNDYTEYARSREHPVPEPLTVLRAMPGVPLPYSTLGVHVTLSGKQYEIPLVTQATKDQLAAPYSDTLAKQISKDNALALNATQYVWKVMRQSPTEVVLQMTISDGGPPVAEITKTFTIVPDSYNVRISHAVKNLTNDAIKVSIDQLAATDMPPDGATMDLRFYHAAGMEGSTLKPERFNLLHKELSAFDASHTREIGSFLGTTPLKWVATSGRFFAAITRPMAEEVGAPAPLLLYGTHKLDMASHVATANVDLIKSETDPINSVGAVRLTGNALDIPAHSANAFPLAVFLGPKKQAVLQGSINDAENSESYHYAALEYVKLIQLNSSTCFIYQHCAIDSLAYYMLKFLDFLKSTVAFGNYGIAIIIMVFLVKAALHPLTRASQINMATMGKKMKDIQPLIEANKKKYAKDKQKQNEEMMRLYKEHNVNPAGGLMGCLPMLLQTPIWIAVWAGLSTDIDLRHAVFIPGWINDLSAPDHTIMFTPFHIPLLSNMMGPINALNVLPLLLGIVIFFQMKVQTASQPKAADPQQAQMQKMSQYMVLIFPLFLYSMPSGINLYYFASTLGGLVDTYFVRKSLKKKGILPTSAQVLPTHEPKDEQVA